MTAGAVGNCCEREKRVSIFLVARGKSNFAETAWRSGRLSIEDSELAMDVRWQNRSLQLSGVKVVSEGEEEERVREEEGSFSDQDQDSVSSTAQSLPVPSYP